MELILTAELQHRESAIRHYQWRIEREAELEEEERKRKLVEAIRLAHTCDGLSSTEAIERWSCWALAQADRIDPAIGGSFLKSMRDEDET